jgi:hypothetical protein
MKMNRAISAITGFGGNQSVAVFSNSQEGRICNLSVH